METPISAHDFLCRFHLPQLIRIIKEEENNEKIMNNLEDENEEDNDNDNDNDNNEKEVEIEIEEVKRNKLKKRKSVKRQENSLTMRDKTEKRCNWTYLEPEFVRANGDRARLTFQLSNSVDLTNNNNKFDLIENEDEKFRSMSTWSMSLNSFSDQVTRNNNNQNNQKGQLINQNNKLMMKKDNHSSVCGQIKSDSNSNSNSLNNYKRGTTTLNSIRLIPPSKRPTLNKLDLDQPFLLYKAFKKVELSAYVIDRRNELNDKSGQPIYFPFNYPGWFSIIDFKSQKQIFAQSPSINGNHIQANNKGSLDSIAQVCESDTQIFLTRDQLIGYRLPSKLSHLTKLKDDKLLALPLAVNLAEGKHKASSSSACPKSVNNLVQITIDGGQVLMVCGIYEDVLPLIERAGQRHGSRHIQLNPSQLFGNSHQHAQQEQINSALYQQQHQYCRRGPNLIEGANYSSSSSHLDLKGYSRKAQKRNQFNNDPGYAMMNPPLIYAAQQTPYPWPLNRSPSGGQRYARCRILNESSLDRLTGLPNRFDEDQNKRSSPSSASSSSSSSSSSSPSSSSSEKDSRKESQDELEVLIPIEQRGRFYLCATNQSILDDLYNYNQANSSHFYMHQRSNRIFRLSQIIYQINMFERLSSSRNNQNFRSMHQQRCTIQDSNPKSIRLPLTVNLISGPRPANFSPTMFGASSTMESYFDTEENVASHRIDCHFNKSYQGNSSSVKRHCDCGRDLVKQGSSKELFGLFSARLRLETLIKRDVLLACTIKKDPLVHLDLFGKVKSHRSLLEIGENSSDRVQANDRLLALRESNEYSGMNDPRSKTKSLGKSSASRFQACRSLISLNGRKKQRPKIPNSMLIPSDNNDNNNYQERQLLTSLYGDTNSSLPSKSGSSQTVESGLNEIIIIEIDCADTKLKFVRTFVEQSIPTGNIPDLVLNRVNYCRNNSFHWERQLKLSYKTLAEDFDSCQRQIEFSNHSSKSILTNHQAPVQTEKRSTKIFIQEPPTQIAVGVLPTETSISDDKEIARSISSSTSSSSSSENSSVDTSTESSRQSSSGVSSSGDRIKQPTTTLTSEMGQVKNSNKLLRFVKRVIPSKNLIRSTSDSKFEWGTIMNSQKIHRRLIGQKSEEQEFTNKLRQLAKDSKDSHLYESLDYLNGQKRASAEANDNEHKLFKNLDQPKSGEQSDETEMSNAHKSVKANLEHPRDIAQAEETIRGDQPKPCLNVDSKTWQTEALEPVSIELNYDQFISSVEEEDDDNGSVELSEWDQPSSVISSGSSRDSPEQDRKIRREHHLGHRRSTSLVLRDVEKLNETNPTDPGSFGQLYANLVNQDSAISKTNYEFQQHRQLNNDIKCRPRGRMERKAMKLRAKRYQQPSCADSTEMLSLPANPQLLDHNNCWRSREGSNSVQCQASKVTESLASFSLESVNESMRIPSSDRLANNYPNQNVQGSRNYSCRRRGTSFILESQFDRILKAKAKMGSGSGASVSDFSSVHSSLDSGDSNSYSNELASVRRSTSYDCSNRPLTRRGQARDRLTTLDRA